MIPESKQQAVKRALLSAFGTDESESISLLTGGLSSALVYKIGVAGKSCLLRLVMRRDAFNDPARQYACMKLAADAGLAPRVWYSDAEDAVAITDFVEAQPLPIDTILPGLAALIKRVHALPCFPRLVDYMDGVDMFIQQFHVSGLLPAEATAKHFGYYREIQRVYPRHQTDLVSSHNDLNPNNILFDGERLWLIDWEASFANDRYVDLANAANSFVHNREQEDVFLQAYFDEPVSDDIRARFFLSRQVCHMFYATCFLRLAAASKPAATVADADMTAPELRSFFGLLKNGQVSLGSYEGQLLYAKVLLKEMLRMMELPRFAESLKRMSQ